MMMPESHHNPELALDAEIQLIARPVLELMARCQTLDFLNVAADALRNTERIRGQHMDEIRRFAAEQSSKASPDQEVLS